MNRQYVSVDLTTLRQLLFASGIRINLAHEEGNQGDQHEQATRLFAQVFDFQKVRYPSPNSNKCFTNLIRTDGYGVDFIFARQESDSAALPELEVNDFSPWELRNTFELWGADPGVTQTYVVANGHSDAPHHIKQMSSVEFSTLAGYYLTNARTRTLKVRENIQPLESQIATDRTANSEGFNRHLRSFFNVYPQVVNFYDERMLKLKFLNYRGKQRAEAEMVEILITGGHKYAYNEANAEADEV